MAEQKQITHAAMWEVPYIMAAPESGRPDGKTYIEVMLDRPFGQGAFIKVCGAKEWCVIDKRTGAIVTRQAMTGPPAPELWRVFDEYVVARRVAASDTKFTYEDLRTGTIIATFPAEPIPRDFYTCTRCVKDTGGGSHCFTCGSDITSKRAGHDNTLNTYSHYGGRIFTIGGKYHVLETPTTGSMASIIHDRKFRVLCEIRYRIHDATNERIWVLTDAANVWCYFDVLCMRIIHTLSVPETFQEWSEKDIAIERTQSGETRMTRFRRFDIPGAAAALRTAKSA